MQGFNMGRYVPPDVEGTTSGNKLHHKHALGGRASKLASQGVLTVRFEMPYAVWCGTCPKPTIIGQGVRFNAEKKKVGAYHSSAIYSFRMRHAACGGAIEIRTDPRNTAYVVVEGGRKRDTGEERRREEGGEETEGGVPILTDREREELRNNAFAKLEKTIEDREQLARAKVRIEELEDESARKWEDPYALNRRLRDTFRVERKGRERDAVTTEDLRDRMGLGIELVPAIEEDTKRAKLVDFGPANDDATGASDRKALAKPLFENPDSKLQISAAKSGRGARRLKSELAASQMRESLVTEIMGNTRASQDPFLVQGRDGDGAKAHPRIFGIKRKRPEADDDATIEAPPVKGTTSSTALVEYESD